MLSNNLNRTIVSILILIVCSLFVYKAFFANVVYETDDYLHHAARLANYYLAVKQGQFPPRIAPNLNDGLGYPAFSYMYHIPYAVGSFLHALNFSVQQSLNLSVLIAVLLAVIGAYLLAKQQKLTNLWSTSLALWYVCNPYTVLTVFWRGAIGELFFYAIVPYFFLATQIKSKYKVIVISLTATFLLLSHLPSVIVLIPLLLLLLIKHKTQVTILELTQSAVLTLGLSAWYIFPAILERWMVTYDSGLYLLQHFNQFLSLPALFSLTRTVNSSDYFIQVIQIGYGTVLATVLTLIVVLSNRKEKKLHRYKTLVTSLLLLVLLIVAMLPQTQPLWDQFKVIKFLQFPWRLLWAVNFLSIYLFIYSYPFIQEKNKKILAITLIACSVVSANNYVHTKGSTSRTDYEWYQTFATGSSFDEHQPIWTKRPYHFPTELLYVTKAELQTNGSENILSYIQPVDQSMLTVKRFDGTQMKYSIRLPEDSIIFHKRIFFPGYEAFIDKNQALFDTTVPEYAGILSLEVPKGEHEIQVSFTQRTPLRKSSEIVTLITVVAIAALFVVRTNRTK